MQVLNLSQDQVNSLPPTERDQIYQLVSVSDTTRVTEGELTSGCPSENNLVYLCQPPEMFALSHSHRNSHTYSVCLSRVLHSLPVV